MKNWRNMKRPSVLQPNLPGLFSTPSVTHRLATPHEQALDVAHNRLLLWAMLFSAAFCIIALRVSFLTLLNVAPDLPASHQEVSDSITARADITDRNGIVLATSLPTVSLCADAKKVINTDEAIKLLLTALPDLNTHKLQDDLHGSKHCAIIKRHLTPKQQYDVNKLGIAGLEFQPDERRVYPAGSVAAHVTGFTDIDNKGIAGMERALDDHLDKNPDTVALSVDLRIQTILRRELQNAITEFHALGAAGLVMDSTTGEIIAMTSLPDFDPQHPGTATDEERFNRDTLGVYEMGSTFKIFNTALALNSGVVHLSDSFNTSHPLEIGHHKIKDFHPENRWLNVAEIFTHSSNIGSALMAERVGGVRQRAFLARLGLTEKIPLELPEVSAPLAPSAHDWGEATTMTAAFGHGIAVNAVQLASAVATIVNNGITVHPTLLKTNILFAQNGQTEAPVITPKTSAVMRALLRLVVTHGTAKGAITPGYLIGGKTGTADKLSANHTYDTHARLSSFVGVFPLNAPHYIVFAMLDDPKGNAKTSGYATGGMVAAPVVGHIVSQIGPLLGIEPLTSEMEATAEKQILKPLGSQILDGSPIEEGSNYALVESDSIQ